MTTTTEARAQALVQYTHAKVRDRYDADLLMAGFEDGARWWQASRSDALEAAINRVLSLIGDIGPEARRILTAVTENASIEYGFMPTERDWEHWSSVGINVEQPLDCAIPTFRGWLAARDKQVAAQAWDEGAVMGGSGAFVTRDQILAANPFRDKAEGARE